MQNEQKDSFVAINNISNASKLSESCRFWTLFSKSFEKPFSFTLITLLVCSF